MTRSVAQPSVQHGPVAGVKMRSLARQVAFHCALAQRHSDAKRNGVAHFAAAGRIEFIRLAYSASGAALPECTANCPN